MRLGLGGGAFGVRGGISTRGVGVGVGPFSAGTSWRGGRSRGGSGGGGLGWAILVAVAFFALAWPYFLGTFVAVRCGAWNPSTERLVVGWCFEVVYIAGLVAWYLAARTMRAQREAAEAQRMAELTASGAVYEAAHGRSAVFRHGTCTVNHKSAEKAASCRKSSPAAAHTTQPAGAAPDMPLPATSLLRSVAAWPAAILVVGLGIGMVILAADPIHTAAGYAASKSCPSVAASDDLSAEIKMPDLIGQNAGSIEAQLKGLGFGSAALESANPSYKSVWVASNWTVVSTDPAPGCAVSRGYGATVYVTK